MNLLTYYGLIFQYRWLLALVVAALSISGFVVYALYWRSEREEPPSDAEAEESATEPAQTGETPDGPPAAAESALAGLGATLRGFVPEGAGGRLRAAVAARLASVAGGDAEGDGDGFDPDYMTLGMALGGFLVFALPLTVYYLQGAWPFGPWHGYTIIGLPFYWVVFFGSILLSLFSLPIYVYFIAPSIPGLGGAMPRLTWIIASFAQGATIFDRASDGRYYARPMRKMEDGEGAEMWVDGEWVAVPGNVEFVTRLAWRPVAITWEKTDSSVREVTATDFGEDPVDYLVNRGMMDRATAEQFQPRGLTMGRGAEAGVPAADGGVAYDEWGAPIDPGDARTDGDGGHSGVPYNVLDYRGHAYQAFTPWPNGHPDGEYIIDTRKVMHKLSGAGETGLIERAKDVALTDTANTTRLGQMAGWAMIFMSLMAGVAVAYFTV